MSRLEFEPLTVEHLEALEQHDMTANRHRLNGIAFALLEDGEPIAAGGVMLLWPRVAKAWTIRVESMTSKLILRRIHAFVRDTLPIVQRVMELDRIEAEALSDVEPQCKWLRCFGFKFEGVMRKFHGGRDYTRYAWVRD